MADTNNNGTENKAPETTKKENFFKRQWDKLPKWKKRTVFAVIGTAAVGSVAYLAKKYAEKIDPEDIEILEVLEDGTEAMTF